MSALSHRKVLVLNKTWTPIGVIGLKRAIGLLFSCYDDGEPKARIIDPTQDFRVFTWKDWAALMPEDGEDTLKASNLMFRVPEVVLLHRYNKLPQQRIHFSRRTIYKRDGNQCQYCSKKPGTEELSIDHVLPRSQGGLTTWENCVLACVECNAKKADKTPKQAGMVLLRDPVKPKWNLFSEDIRVESWQHFLGESYWLCTLENDVK